MEDITTRKFYNIEQQGNPLRQVKKGRPMWLHVEQELLVLPKHRDHTMFLAGVLMVDFSFNNLCCDDFNLGAKTV
jgi:hypothetical protein